MDLGGQKSLIFRKIGLQRRSLKLFCFRGAFNIDFEAFWIDFVRVWDGLGRVLGGLGRDLGPLMLAFCRFWSPYFGIDDS